MPIYRDIYDGPPRWYGDTRTHKRYVAIHATANDASAEAEASWAKRRPDQTSSHYYVDDDSIVQSLDTDLRAFHAGSRIGNDLAISYELTARDMSVGKAWWLDHDNIEWPLLVGAIARDCQHFGITPRNLTVAELKAGTLTGLIMHWEMGDAWGGTDHTDPGPNFPMDHLVSQVQAAMGDDDMAYLDWSTADRDALAHDVWRRFNGRDYVNEKPTTKDHQVARAHDYSLEAARLSRQNGETLAAVLEAVTGGDQAAILARIDAHHAEQNARFVELAGALEAAADERDALAELVRQAQSGERDAAAVVDEIGRRLAPVGTPASG